jgi:protocatechuate 3,4-dioxygenase beta subunit
MRTIFLTTLLAMSVPASASSESLHQQLIEIERSLPIQAEMLRTRVADPEVALDLDSHSQWIGTLTDDKVEADIRRKARSLELLIKQVRVAPESLGYGGPPTLSPTILAESQAGRSCEAAIPFELGSGHRVAIAARDSLWFRVNLPYPSLIRVSSRGSTIDASLDIHADCRTSSGSPTATGDDEHGLQAEVAIPAGQQTFWYVRLTNKGEQAGEATVFATRSAILQGSVRSRAGNLPVDGGSVALWRVEGEFFTLAASTSADQFGNWRISFVSPGTYALRADRALGIPGLLGQAFSEIPCRASSSPSACGTPGNRFTPITVGDGDTRTFDFRLDTGAVLTGVVRNAQTQAPIAGARVRAVESGSTGNLVSQPSDGLGRYRIEGLFPGTVFLAANAEGFEGMLFDGVPCFFPLCEPTNPAATPLTVGLATQATANFSMTQAKRIRVAVSIGGQPVVSTVSFRPRGALFNEAGQFVMSTDTDQNGFLLFPSLTSGTYRLRVTSPRTVPQMYQSVLCVDEFCNAEFGLGTPIVVSPASGSVDLTIDLRAAPSVFGRLLEDPSGLPIVDADVRLISTNGPSRNAVTDSTGRYRFDGVSPGTYRVVARSQRHVDEVFDNIACDSEFGACPGAALIPMSYLSPDVEANFALRRSGRIEARLFAPTSPTEGVSWRLQLLTPTGQVVTNYNLFSLPDAPVLLSDVVPGSHVLAASVFFHISQLHPLLDCTGESVPTGCPLAAATPVTVVSDSTLTGIRFNVRRIDGVLPVRVRSAVDGTPLANVSIDIWSPAGFRAGIQQTRFDGIAWLSVGLLQPFNEPFLAFLSTDNRQGFIDEVYDNRACPNGPAFLGLCSLTGATTVSIPQVGSGSLLDIVLDPRDDLFVNGFEP